MIPLTAALWSVLPSVAVGGVAPLASAPGRRFGRALVIAGGFAVMAAGFALLTVVGAHSQLSVVLVAASPYANGGVGLMSQVSEVVMAAAPTERAGTASALLESGTELGRALGMAVLGSVGTALYRSRIGGQLPADLPATARGAVRDSPGGTEGVLAQLLEAVRGPVLAAARDAFCGGTRAPTGRRRLGRPCRCGTAAQSVRRSRAGFPDARGRAATGRSPRRASPGRTSATAAGRPQGRTDPALERSRPLQHRLLHRMRRSGSGRWPHRLAFLSLSTTKRQQRPDIAYRPVTGLSPSAVMVAWPETSRSAAVAAFVQAAHDVAAHLPDRMTALAY